MAKKQKKEKWKAITGEGHPFRYVVNQEGMLVADCYADSADRVGLPDNLEYKRLTKRIAMLPELVELLEEAATLLRYGSFTHCKVQHALERYNKLKPR